MLFLSFVAEVRVRARRAYPRILIMKAVPVFFLRTVITLRHNIVARDPSRACSAGSLVAEVECIVDADKLKERDVSSRGKMVSGPATKLQARSDKEMKQINTIG